MQRNNISNDQGIFDKSNLFQSIVASIGTLLQSIWMRPLSYAIDFCVDDGTNKKQGNDLLELCLIGNRFSLN